MGTWDVGPFANDTAADFCGDLDEVAAGEREGIVRSALTGCYARFRSRCPIDHEDGSDRISSLVGWSWPGRRMKAGPPVQHEGCEASSSAGRSCCSSLA
uniref:DUF4259 domain-containing protein n=1 Tax=Streptomyces sp. NBC_00003 TaxID=2903608 RepID=A0AAU2UWB0_9ACTN